MLGIDVSKATLATTLLDPQTKRVLWQQTFPNSASGVQHLLERVPAETPWVLEPTGRYSLWVAKPATQAGRSVLLAPSRRAKRFHESLPDRCKTDRLDSRSLALFGLSQPLFPYPIKSERVQELQQLLAARKSLVQTISRLAQQASELPYAASALAEAVAPLKEQRKKLDHKIQTLTADQTAYPHVARLKKVEGIGPVTAAAVSACLMERGFTHSDQFVAFLGLDVVIVQSGRRKGNKGLSKHGEAELRRLLFNCARAAVWAKNSPFRDQFERESQKHLSKTAIYCSIARKMARLCWSLVRHNAEYDPARVFVQKGRAETNEPAKEPSEAN